MSANWPQLVALVWMLVTAAAAAAAADAGFYCLEEVIPVGKLLQNLTVPLQQQLTAGQTARWCNAQCSNYPGCSTAWSAGALADPGPTCLLLQPGEESWSQAFSKTQPGKGYPQVQPHLKSRDGAEGQRRQQLSWLCMRQHQWDDMGAALNLLYGDGQPVGAWCALGHDVAGSNVERLTSLTSPRQCAASCAINPSCTQWIFVQTLSGSSSSSSSAVPDGFDCWLKRSSFIGRQGWSAAYQDDGYAVPDSAVACFKQLGDWRAYGRLLSPDTKTYAYGALNYTIFPETVSYSEAAAACSSVLANGSLAVLSSRDLLVAMDEHLLLTLPWKRSLKTAWVGFEGRNAAHGRDPAATMSPRERERLSNATQASLHWVLPEGGSMPVEASHLKQLRDDNTPWTMHSNLADPVYVPPSSASVCGRLVNQLPPSQAAAMPGDAQPGVWYFDCSRRPAAFLCQSAAVPADLASLDRVLAYKFAADNWDAMRDTHGPSNNPTALMRKVVLSVVVCTACLGLALLLLLGCAGSRHFSKLQFLLGHQRKRALGRPSNGRLSVVVTDIQGYSQLMDECPEDMQQVLQVHNAIVRHAAYVHAGFVVETEGDCFVLCFHEPLDAAAFCLQVQQALLEADMPPSISYNDGWEAWSSGNSNSHESLLQPKKQQQQSPPLSMVLPAAADSSSCCCAGW